MAPTRPLEGPNGRITPTHKSPLHVRDVIARLSHTVACHCQAAANNIVKLSDKPGSTRMKTMLTKPSARLNLMLPTALINWFTMVILMPESSVSGL